jgi:hypothetical protein
MKINKININYNHNESYLNNENYNHKNPTNSNSRKNLLLVSEMLHILLLASYARTVKT